LLDRLGHRIVQSSPSSGTVLNQLGEFGTVTITSLMDLAASTIAVVYTRRWQIGAFFMALKQAPALLARLILKFLQMKSSFGWCIPIWRPCSACGCSFPATCQRGLTTLWVGKPAAQTLEQLPLRPVLSSDHIGKTAIVDESDLSPDLFYAFRWGRSLRRNHNDIQS
jgi:hypothetical protein